MEKLNYELVGKRATIEGLISGEIKISELDDIYILNIENESILSLSDTETSYVFDAINNPNVLFVQETRDTKSYTSEDDEDEWDNEEEEYVPVKKKVKRK